jgi:hypothetical protein
MMKFEDVKVKDLKDVLIKYNKSVRKLTYKGVSKKRKSEVIEILNSDFKPKFGEKSINLKHKSGRFTKKLKK